MPPKKKGRPAGSSKKEIEKLSKAQKLNVVKDLPGFEDLPTAVIDYAMEFITRPVGRPPATQAQQLAASEKQKERNRLVARRDKAMLSGDYKKFMEIQGDLYSRGIIGRKAYDNSNTKFLNQFNNALGKVKSNAERSRILNDVLGEALEERASELSEAFLRTAQGELEDEERTEKALDKRAGDLTEAFLRTAQQELSEEVDLPKSMPISKQDIPRRERVKLPKQVLIPERMKPKRQGSADSGYMGGSEPATPLPKRLSKEELYKRLSGRMAKSKAIIEQAKQAPPKTEKGFAGQKKRRGKMGGVIPKSLESIQERETLDPEAGGMRQVASQEREDINPELMREEQRRRRIEYLKKNIPNRKPPMRPDVRESMLGERIIRRIKDLERNGEYEKAEEVAQYALSKGFISRFEREPSEADIEEFMGEVKPNQLKDNFSIYSTESEMSGYEMEKEEELYPETAMPIQPNITEVNYNQFDENYSAGGGVGGGLVTNTIERDNEIEQPAVWSTNEFLVDSQVINNAENRELYKGVNPNNVQATGVEGNYFEMLNDAVLAEDREEIDYAQDRLNVLTGGSKDSLFGANDLSSTKRKSPDDEEKYHVENVTDNQFAPSALQRGEEAYGYDEFDGQNITLNQDGYLSTPLGMIENIRGIVDGNNKLSGRSNEDIQTSIIDGIKLAGKRGLYGQDKTLAQDNPDYVGYEIEERTTNMSKAAMIRDANRSNNDPFLMTYGENRQVKSALDAGQGRAQGASLKELRQREFDYQTPNRKIAHDGYKFFRGGNATFSKIMNEFEP